MATAIQLAMNTWECEECGATADTEQRKECIKDACDQRCRWFKLMTSDQTDNDEPEEE